ncbi:MAG: hypothetical protein C5B51_16410 [Terriglobia bacterium]|nr:MAG: hypothetical protein C5B51_16410 [Terriglobia bacterium]
MQVCEVATQDNNNVWAAFGDDTWRPLDDLGDGGPAAVFQHSPDILALSSSSNNAKPLQWSRWEGAGWSRPVTIPTNLGGNSLDDNGLQPVFRFRQVDPSVGMLAGPAMSPVMAIAAGPAFRLKFINLWQTVIYGAIDWRLEPPEAIVHPRFVEWVELARLPIIDNITALEAFDQTRVLAGTESGRLYAVSIPGGFRELAFDPPDATQVIAIASDGRTIACAKGSSLYVGATGPQPLRRLEACVFPPNGYGRHDKRPCDDMTHASAVFRTVRANRNAKYVGLTFAAVVSENEVWVSNSPVAAIWQRVSEGLPLGVRVTDLAFWESPSRGELLLSTFGRSLWRLRF